MKGKYANAAEKRRVMDSLEARVRAAEKDAEDARSALAAAAERSALEVGSLKERLRTVTAERDTGQSAAIAALEEQANALRAEATAAREQAKRVKKTWDVTWQGMHAYLVRVLGFTGTEAIDVLVNFAPRQDGEEAAVFHTSDIVVAGRRLPGLGAQEELTDHETAAALTIERARGKRRRGDKVHEAVAPLLPGDDEAAVQ